MRKSITARLHVVGLVLTLLVNVGSAATAGSDWFAVQRPPKRVAKCEAGGDFAPIDLMAQSLAGLAAQAVNEGRFDELVWIDKKTPSYDQWYRDAQKRLGFDDAGSYSAWDLVKRYHDKSIFKGYILYRYDTAEGAPYVEREQVDQSANVATALAGVRKGILIDETLEAQAQALGLTKLIDVRDKDIVWCYENYRHRLNRHMLLTADPKAPHNRAYAIAHRCAVAYDVGDDTALFCKWLEPPAPILGWNCADEMSQTALVTEYGHFQTATNWALNLTILSAQKPGETMQKIEVLDPKKIPWDDKRYAASFLLSDGDNIQWTVGGFFFSKHYWANENQGHFPFGWTSCPSHLRQIAPDVYDYLRRTKPASHTVVEYGAGYYYPDLFACKRDNRQAILTTRARHMSVQMNKCGAQVLAFICKDINSAGAQEAYEIYAREIEGLIGMIAFQYYPYNAGNGKIFWVTNKDGIDIPVLTATHSLWAKARWDHGGGPADIAREINAYAAGEDKTVPEYSLVATHAWSAFKQNEEDKKQYKGLTPVQWCIDAFSDQVRVVSPEELIWRVRMAHRPEQTKRFIE